MTYGALSQYVFWLLGSSLVLVSLIIILRKGVHKQLPEVMWWHILQLTGTVLLLIIDELIKHRYVARSLHTDVYGPLQVLSSGVMLAVVCSFWRRGLNNSPGLQRLFAGVLLILLALVVLGMAFLMTRTTAESISINNWIGQWYTLVFRSLTVIQSAMLLLFFAFVARFRMGLSVTLRNIALWLFLFTIVRIVIWSYGYLRGELSLPYVLAVLVTGNLFAATWAYTLWRYKEEEQIVVTAPQLSKPVSPSELQALVTQMDQQLVRLLG